MKQQSLTLRQALDKVRCPICGADPGNDCVAETPLPEGKHRVHTERLYGIPISPARVTISVMRT